LHGGPGSGCSPRQRRFFDPAVWRAVLFDHAEGRGFCAGGDIRMLAESGAKDGRQAREFFFTEYQTNERLFTYRKPTVAFMDGITMGGGVGISLPCKFRVATENTRFAMP
ncbi:enoyl-CoA hydratase/isomerase family protein, partial [Salmonella enterica subsp. enterica serovar Typhimurium]|nr:enoyl-CoA hydratase/isomerase family protein [Salmonella enterica subsp. enterica serovar Typhimurium]